MCSEIHLLLWPFCRYVMVRFLPLWPLLIKLENGWIVCPFTPCVLIICRCDMKLNSCTSALRRWCAVNIQVTDCGRSVFPMNADTDQMDEVTLNLYNHLCSLLCQRDFYIRVSNIHGVTMR